MRYVLVTPNGKQLVFHIQHCAEIFRIVYGGYIVVDTGYSIDVQ